MKEFLRKRQELESDNLFISIRKYILSPKSTMIADSDIMQFISVLKLYGFYKLIQQIVKIYDIKVQEPSILHSEIMIATDSEINKKIFDYKFIIYKKEDLTNYIFFIHDIFSHPDSRKIGGAIICKLFREISSGVYHNKFQIGSWNAFYGLLLILSSDKILKYLKSQSVVQLKKILFKVASNAYCGYFKENSKPTRISLLVRKLKQCNDEDQV